MNNLKDKLFYSILWGTGIYALQDFLQQPNKRARILTTIVLAFIIFSINTTFINGRFYQHRILRQTIPMLIMNCVLIPVYVLAIIFLDFTLTGTVIVNYLIFNIVILGLNMYLYRYFKRRINDQLKNRVASLD